MLRAAEGVRLSRVADENEEGYVKQSPDTQGQQTHDAHDLRALRNALGCYPTGVAIVTARIPGGRHVGVTVNSFTSLSLDPPLLLFCLARKANVLAAFDEAPHFAINVLAHAQHALSSAFARPTSARIEDWKHVAGDNGCALLDGALASFECRKRECLPGGDHVIFVGEVTAFRCVAAAGPLVFYQGQYGTFARESVDAGAETKPPHAGVTAPHRG